MHEVGIGVKLGLEFFCAHGTHGVKKIMQIAPKTPIFLDLKFHDIPNTVGRSITACRDLGVAYINVHAGGGAAMMAEAKKQSGDMKVLAVTVLTALDAAALDAVGQGSDVTVQVTRLAHLTQECGLDGVVCSPLEIEILRKKCGPDFVLMVPGVRPVGSDMGDQKRIMTPFEAYQRGATHLVIGRPITDAPDPVMAARKILAELS